MGGGGWGGWVRGGWGWVRGEWGWVGGVGVRGGWGEGGERVRMCKVCDDKGV